MPPTKLEIMSLLKRDTKLQCTDSGCEEMPVSNWQKSGIPIIIGVVLFVIAIAVLGFIVWKKRKMNKAQEDAKNREIDMEDMEVDSEPQHGKKNKRKNRDTKEDADDFH